MPQYTYKAKTADGRVVQETIEAESHRLVLNKLREQKLTIIEITERKSGQVDWKQDIFASLRQFQKVNEQALTVFSRQFATMINAGLAMVRCLDILSEQTEDRKLQATLLSVRKDVEGGQSLSNSMAKYPTVFSNLYVSMVRAGELGGVLDEVLDRLAGFMERDFNLKKKVKSALTYPVVILIMAILIVTFLVLFILPTFVKLFKGMDVKLPLPTRILMDITNGVRIWYIDIAVLVILVVLFAIFAKWVQTPKGKLYFDQFKLQIPVFGMLNKKVSISRFCRTLGTLLSSGVPIMQALEIVGKVSGNEVVAETIIKVRESIREGESIAGPLQDSGLFPPMVTQMVAVGEETGNLDAMLSKIADFYDTEVEYMLSSLTSMLEPLLILGMGGIVGFIVISVFMPLYGLIGHLGNPNGGG
jgi:type IV pilus assembly protein PilC